MRSWSDGWRRVVLGARRSWPASWALTFLLALPLAITMRGLLEAHLGSSLAADSAASGVNYDWWQEFTSQATGIGTTFSPTIIGFAATLDNISSLLDGQREVLPVAGAHRPLSRRLDVPRRRHHRSLRAAAADAGLRILCRVGRSLLSAAAARRRCRESCTGGSSPTSIAGCFSNGSSTRTRIIGVEREVFLWRLALYLVFGLVLVLVNVTFDYAKIRLVVEDRRSALGALSAAMRFVWRHRGRVAGLYALNGAGVSRAARGLGPDRARRRGRRSHDLGDLSPWPALSGRQARAQAAVPRVRDVAVPVHARPRRVRRGTAAVVARVALGRAHRAQLELTPRNRMRQLAYFRSA